MILNEEGTGRAIRIIDLSIESNIDNSEKLDRWKQLEKIGSFYEETKNLNINGDRGRMWLGRLTDVRLKEHNISVPFNLDVFDVTKI